MRYFTLREVCENTGVSRRAIQGYEKKNLVSASKRNKRGYLLYDEEALGKIRTIRLFQQLGFLLNEIYEMKKDSKAAIKEKLENRIVSLENEKDKIDQLVEQARRLIEHLEDNEEEEKSK